MFKAASVAKFNSNGHEAIFIINNEMPISDFQAILSRAVHFCEEKKIEAQQEEAQRIKDEEASKPPELEAEEPPKEVEEKQEE